MTDALTEVVADARLTQDAGRRHRFTVAHQEAVLALRARPAEPWAFTLPLVRAAIVLDREAVATVTAGEETTGRFVAFAFVVPAAVWDEIDLAGLLSASLVPDRGHDPSRPVSVASAWHRLVGRAVNGALGEDVPWVELRTPVGGRRWDRVVTQGADPYVERLRSEPGSARTVELRVGQPAPSLVKRLWSSPSRVVAEIAKLWSLRLGHDVDDLGSGIRLLTATSPDAIDLGGFATWWPDPRAPQLVLVRDGVALAPVHAPELADPRLRGRIDCPALALDIDEKQVVADDELDTLLAWLLEAIAEPHVTHEIDARTEVFYVWRHRARDQPAGVIGVWPGELARMRAQAPDVDFVPFAALREGTRADLTALEQGSVGAFEIDTPPLELDDGPTVTVRVTAYVHRYPAAEQGVLLVLAWHRQLARVEDPARVVAGATVIVDLGDASQAVVADANVIEAAIAHARKATLDASDRLLAAAIERVGTDEACWSVPFVRARLDALDATTLGLHFVVREDRLRLAWDDSPALAVQIGRERDGTRRTLADALVRARDVGGVVVGDEAKVWYTLESADPSLTAWLLHDRGRALLLRVLGSTVLWTMPIVPEAEPQPRPLAEQPQLVLGREEVVQKLEGRDPRATDHLVAHLLAQRNAGRPSQELEDAPLLRRYDPRALTPRTRVSLTSVLAEHTLRVAPIGAVGRWLGEPVLEASPAIASLLHETLAVVPALRPQPDTAEPHARVAPVSVRRVDPAAMLVRIPIASKLCAGALHLADGPNEGIELWARGLRVGAFRLPSPLRELGGRLWLTDAGVEAGHAGLVKVALVAGKELVERAVAALALSPPHSPRAAALHVFLDRVRQHVRARPDFMHLRDVVGVDDASVPEIDIAALRGLPPPRERLQTLLRWALARPVQVDTAWLSWRAVKVLDAATPGRLELGSRHAIVGAALDDRATLDQLWAAAIVVVAATLAAAPALARVDIAFARILATARVHSSDAPP